MAADTVRPKASHPSTPPSGLSRSPSLRLSRSRPALHGETQDRGSSPLSYARVQAAGGAQGALGREPDYWAYTAPPMTSAANRVFAQSFKHEENKDIPEAPRNDHLDAYNKSGNLNKLLSIDEGVGRDREGPMQARSANLRDSVHAFMEGPTEGDEEQQDLAAWQEPYEEEEEQEPAATGLL
ncbi:hypothetical protein Emag_001002 [Eimeria magna]